MAKIELRHGWDEEIEYFYLDDEYLFSTNHDENGWSGMASVREVIKTICEKTGIEFEEVYVDDDKLGT